MVSFDLKSNLQESPDLVHLLPHLQAVRALSADKLPSLVRSQPHELGATNSLDADVRNRRATSKKNVHATQASHGTQLTARRIRSTMAPHHLEENSPPFASSQQRNVSKRTSLTLQCACESILKIPHPMRRIYPEFSHTVLAETIPQDAGERLPVLVSRQIQ
jgi:hypothetical protein